MTHLLQSEVSAFLAMIAKAKAFAEFLENPGGTSVVAKGDFRCPMQVVPEPVESDESYEASEALLDAKARHS
jgi:hypothetical protein